MRRFSRWVRKKRQPRQPTSTRVPQTVHQAPAAFQGEVLPRSQNTAAKLAWLRTMKKMRAGRKRSGAAQRSCPREICLAIS
jgi:hypothetical protein